jgi:hypothetical protein
MVGQEIRAVVKDYTRDRMRIYFPTSFIEFEGTGRGSQDLIPYFKPADDSGNFYFLPLGFVGKTIASATTNSEGGAPPLLIQFTDGTDVIVEPYLGDGLKIIQSDELSAFGASDDD